MFFESSVNVQHTLWSVKLAGRLKQSSTRKHLQDLILIHNKWCLWGEFDWTAAFYVCHLGHLWKYSRYFVIMYLWICVSIYGYLVISFLLQYFITCLNVTKVTLGDKRNVDWEEVVGFAIYTELQAATLVLLIDNGKWPFQDVFPAVMVILPIQIADHWSTYSWPE